MAISLTWWKWSENLLARLKAEDWKSVQYVYKHTQYVYKHTETIEYVKKWIHLWQSI